MKKAELTCYRYLSNAEFDKELGRLTKDVKCIAVPYTKEGRGGPGTGRRMIKLRHHSGHVYHYPARDFKALLEALDFDVRDLR